MSLLSPALLRRALASAATTTALVALIAAPAEASTITVQGVSAQGAGTSTRPNFKHSPVTAGCTRTGYVDDRGNPDPDPCTDLPLASLVVSAQTASKATARTATTIGSGRWTAPTRVRAVRFDPDPIFGSCGSTTIGIYTLSGTKLWSAAPSTCRWVTVPASLYEGRNSRLLLRGALTA